MRTAELKKVYCGGENILQENSQDELTKCEICNQAFTKPNYYSHVRNNKGKYPCLLNKKCHRTFCQKRQLKLHITIDHKKAKFFPCNICGESFMQSYPRDLHIRRGKN